MKTHYQCRFKNLPKIINLRQTIYQPQEENKKIEVRIVKRRLNEGEDVFGATFKGRKKKTDLHGQSRQIVSV